MKRKTGVTINKLPPEEAEIWERIQAATSGRVRSALFNVHAIAVLMEERDELRRKVERQGRALLEYQQAPVAMADAQDREAQP